MPHDSVIAEPREEVEDGVVRRQLAALGEAADGEDVAVEAPCVALVAAVLADARLGAQRMLKYSQIDLPLSRACGARTDDTARLQQTNWTSLNARPYPVARSA